MKNNGQQSQFTAIDSDRLDEEWMRQPGLYHRHAVQLADAKQRHAEAKAELDVVEAECSLTVRKTPEAYLGDVKATETSIAAVVLTTPRYRKAMAVMIEAKHACDVLEAAVWALDHKKKGLENLVQLRLADYYSSPRKPKDVPAETINSMEQNARKAKMDRMRPERGK